MFLYKYIDPLSYLLAESSSAREIEKLVPGLIMILPGHSKSNFLAYQGDKEGYIVWAEGSVFLSMT